MLNWLHNKGIGLRFYKPDDGGNSKGSAPAGDSPKVGAIDVEKLLSEIPLEELDEPTRKKFETARDTLKTGVATLQSSLENATNQAKEFQSQKDQLDAKLRQIQPDPAKQTDDDFLKAVKEIMQKNGFKPEQIEQQAGVFAEMLKASGTIIHKKVGESVAPMATEVIQQQASSAFQEAQSSDTVGILQIPEVAQATWDLVKQRIEAKANTTPEIVRNLAKMVYVDYLGERKAKGETVAELVPATAPNMNTTFSYPGAGRGQMPIMTKAPDPNAAKTTMNADTESAVTQTMKKMTAGHDFKKKPPILEKTAA